MKTNVLENISSIINQSKEMLIIGFIDKNNIVDILISQKIKLVTNSLNFNIEIYEFDAESIENYYNHFNLITIPTFNIYYNSVLLDQIDLLDSTFEIKKRFSNLTIN